LPKENLTKKITEQNCRLIQIQLAEEEYIQNLVRNPEDIGACGGVVG
jgi:hypothetical protein